MNLQNNLNIKKIFLTIVAIVLFAQIPCIGATINDDDDEISLNEKIASIGFGKIFVSDPKKDICEIFKKLDSYTEKNDLPRMKKLFSPDFVNNDGFDHETYMKSVKNGFSSYTNRKVTTTIKDIKIFDDYAVAYVTESGEASTLKPTAGIEGNGLVIATADVYYYFTKYGRKWKITSANVIDENCAILYGAAKSVYFSLNIPTQVKAGSEFTSTLSFAPMKDTIVMAALSSEPIVFPMPFVKDIFKTVKGDGILERVFVANSDNYNEYAIASIGMSKAQMLDDASFNLKLTGTGYIIRRVNVFKPMSQKVIDTQKKNVVHKSENQSGVN